MWFITEIVTMMKWEPSEMQQSVDKKAIKDSSMSSTSSWWSLTYLRDNRTRKTKKVDGPKNHTEVQLADYNMFKSYLEMFPMKTLQIFINHSHLCFPG